MKNFRRYLCFALQRGHGRTTYQLSLINTLDHPHPGPSLSPSTTPHLKGFTWPWSTGDGKITNQIRKLRPPLAPTSPSFRGRANRARKRRKSVSGRPAPSASTPRRERCVILFGCTNSYPTPGDRKVSPPLSLHCNGAMSFASGVIICVRPSTLAYLYVCAFRAFCGCSPPAFGQFFVSDVPRPQLDRRAAQ